MNVLLDCGTHFGEGLDYLITNYNIDQTWKCLSFEANPITYKKHQEYRKYTFVEYLQKAVYTFDGEIQINIDSRDDDAGGGSSLMDLKFWNPQGLRDKNIFTKNTKTFCFDFSTFLKNNYNLDDNIICKFDIEGSEYNVLEKMIKDDTLKYIKTLAIEFHSDFFDNKKEYYVRENNIRNEIKKNNINLIQWW